jgi:hypothetical protein
MTKLIKNRKQYQLDIFIELDLNRLRTQLKYLVNKVWSKDDSLIFSSVFSNGKFCVGQSIRLRGHGGQNYVVFTT